MADSPLTHLDDAGAAHMVDVSEKTDSVRQAVAEGFVRMGSQTLHAILAGDAKKGDVIGTARLAGIMAAKKTSDLIPLCHPLPISKVAIDIETFANGLRVVGTVRVTGKTGVEMEALTAVSVACLTIYDMAKALDKAMVIDGLALVEKTGGKSGVWRRDRPATELA